MRDGSRVHPRAGCVALPVGAAARRARCAPRGITPTRTGTQRPGARPVNASASAGSAMARVRQGHAMAGSVYVGKSFDEAVRKGLEALRLTRAEAVITTVEEGKGGFLGIGSRPFKVSVARRPGGAIREPAERTTGGGASEERRGGRRGGR